MSIFEHLATGTTTVCRCWAVLRRDGVKLGFTDHDEDLSFQGIAFRADTGMTARAFVQSTGLAVDNTEGIGALSDDAIREADIQAGRYDGASVTMWLVNWADTSQRSVRFAGSIGEIVRSGDSFRAELRGLTEGLNKPQGFVFQRTCSAVLGDHRCRVDLDRSEYRAEVEIEQVSDAKTFTFATFPTFKGGWFERGMLAVLDGDGAGLSGHIKVDRTTGSGRRIVLWQSIQAELKPGERIHVLAGCDKLFRTCRNKFDNIMNFRGFPSIPGEDWLMAYPNDRTPNNGGRL
jgi:uncharacterized phage protein (TIGR02218 family)